jgi:uncharacterized protein (UPF0297 family)
MKENFVRRHVTELKGQADLGEKPESVQTIRRKVYNSNRQTGENPVLKHVQELHGQSKPAYSKERIEEARTRWPVLTTEEIIRNLKDEDRRKEDKRLGRRRGFGFF